MPLPDYAHAHFAELTPRRSPVGGALAVPGSKSISNRVVLLAMVAQGRSVLTGLLESDDTRWALDVAGRLGATVTREGEQIVIDGIGRARPVATGELHVGSAGTLARFLPGLLAAGAAGRWHLTASEQMMARPVDALVKALQAGGAKIAIEGAKGGYPLTVEGASLTADRLFVPGNVSSQFISGAMLAGPLMDHALTIETGGNVVQSDYVRITADTMAQFGAAVTMAEDLSSIATQPGGYRGQAVMVEADASTATYFAALPALFGGAITISNLRRDTRQPDIGFLDVLQKMGCTVRAGAEGVTVSRAADAGPLKGGFDLDMRPLSDSALTAAALAVFADAPIRIHGVAHIRHHECDRVAAMAEALAAFGIACVEHEDGWTITPGAPRFAETNSHDDHRVAMATALIGFAGAGARIGEPGCVAKTCPDYFHMMDRLGMAIRIVG